MQFYTAGFHLEYLTSQTLLLVKSPHSHKRVLKAEHICPWITATLKPLGNTGFKRSNRDRGPFKHFSQPVTEWGLELYLRLGTRMGAPHFGTSRCHWFNRSSRVFPRLQSTDAKTIFPWLHFFKCNTTVLLCACVCVWSAHSHGCCTFS